MPGTTIGVVPSVMVISQGEVPVKSTARVASLPLQMVCEPLMVAMGRGVTSTSALPVPAVEHKLTSVTLRRV